MKRPARKIAALAAGASLGIAGACLTASCGGSAALTPELIGQQAFELLKADNFTDYISGVVANVAIVSPLCAGLPGLMRYFDSGEGAERPQNDRWVECRAAVDFSKAIFVRANATQNANSTLVPPSCAMPLIQVDVKVDLTVGGKAATFTIADVTQFNTGWRAYGRLKNCSTAQ